MAIAERRNVGARLPESLAGESAPRGFRPTSRRRARLAVGAALAAAAVGGNVLVYASLNDKTEVLQVIDKVPAGELVTADNLRVVEVDLDPTVPFVSAADIGLVVNQYARVHLAEGTLIVAQLVQPTPLVSPGMAVVAVEISPSGRPEGLRARSRVQLVIPVEQSGGSPPAIVIDGRVVAESTAVDSITGELALSVEVASVDAATVAAADDVRVVLVDPGVDPAGIAVVDERSEP